MIFYILIEKNSHILVFFSSRFYCLFLIPKIFEKICGFHVLILLDE